VRGGSKGEKRGGNRGRVLESGLCEPAAPIEEVEPFLTRSPGEKKTESKHVEPGRNSGGTITELAKKTNTREKNTPAFATKRRKTGLGKGRKGWKNINY